MAYRLLKQKAAAEEVSWLKNTYGHSFIAAFDRWINELCEQAEAKTEFETAEDVERIIEDLLNEKMPSDFKRSWNKVKASGWADRAKALLAFIRNRCPPWRARVLERHGLPGLDGHIPIAIRLYISIDDVKKVVVIRAVDQLES